MKNVTPWFVISQCIGRAESGSAWCSASEVNNNTKTKNFIGICGLLTQEIDEKKEIEVGYHILKKFWGQGYATEAAKLFIDYAFKNELANSIVSVIDVENFKSQKVAKKNGLTIEKKTKWLDNEDVYIYRIFKEN